MAGALAATALVGLPALTPPASAQQPPAQQPPAQSAEGRIRYHGDAKRALGRVVGFTGTTDEFRVMP